MDQVATSVAPTSDADVILTRLALGYYMQGQAERRLHDEVIAPARNRGYTQVWLAGASLVRDGGHAWSVWSPATREILMRAETTTKTAR